MNNPHLGCVTQSHQVPSLQIPIKSDLQPSLHSQCADYDNNPFRTWHLISEQKFHTMYMTGSGG